MVELLDHLGSSLLIQLPTSYWRYHRSLNCEKRNAFFFYLGCWGAHSTEVGRDLFAMFAPWNLGWHPSKQWKAFRIAVLPVCGSSMHIITHLNISIGCICRSFLARKWGNHGNGISEMRTEFSDLVCLYESTELCNSSWSGEISCSNILGGGFTVNKINKHVFVQITWGTDPIWRILFRWVVIF